MELTTFHHYDINTLLKDRYWFPIHIKYSSGQLRLFLWLLDKKIFLREKVIRHLNNGKTSLLLLK